MSRVDFNSIFVQGFMHWRDAQMEQLRGGGANAITTSWANVGLGVRLDPTCRFWSAAILLHGNVEAEGATPPPLAVSADELAAREIRARFMRRVTNMEQGGLLRLCVRRAPDAVRPRRGDAVATLMRRGEQLFRITPDDEVADEVLVPLEAVERKLGDVYELGADDQSGSGLQARQREARERRKAKEVELDARVAEAVAARESQLEAVVEVHNLVLVYI